MALTLGTKTYTADRVYPDSIKHVSADNALGAEDSLTLGRSYPKRTDVSEGNARPSIKFVETVTVGEKKLDLIFNGSLQIPVGVPAANVQAFNDRIAAFFGTTAADDLAIKLDINL